MVSKRKLLLAVFSGVLLSTTFLGHGIPKSLIYGESITIPQSTGTPRDPSPGPTLVGLPVRLKIPSINVDAPIEQAGLTSKGAMDVPKGPVAVAWFNLGPRPGENGSSVIAGHFGWKNNIPAVFDNLHMLREGDRISTEDTNGAIATFVVRKIDVYTKDGDASDIFGSGDGKAHLNLITCTGTWNEKEKTRSDRLIVFADLE